MVQIFQARHGLIEYSTASEDWRTNQLARLVLFTGTATECKDFSIEVPETQSEQVNLMGNSQQTAGTATLSSGSAIGAIGGFFQNSFLEMKAAGPWKFSGTVVAQGDENFVQAIGLSSGTAVTGGATRYGYGDFLDTGALARPLNGAMRLFLDDGTNQRTFVLTNVNINKQGPMKPTGADGHWEQEVEGMCLTRDGFEEFLN